jgi:DNA adenine methylase
MKPLLKWVGGKRRLIPKIEHLFPTDFKNYYEPFIGGGAIFLYLKDISYKRTWFINDKNSDLINCYEQIKWYPEEVFNSLRKIAVLNSKELYYSVRDRFNEHSCHPIMQSALFLYLSSKCFNGLIRYNKSGRFNTPIHAKGHEDRKIPTLETIMDLHHMLNRTKISCVDWSLAIETAKTGDFVVLDPPYYPISNTANFTSYTGDGFGVDEQEKLAKTMSALADRGVMVMAFNNYLKETFNLYKKDPRNRIFRIKVKRYLRMDGSNAHKSYEMCVINY